MNSKSNPVGAPAKPGNLPSIARLAGLVILTMMTDTLRDFTIPTPTIAGDSTMSKGQDSKKQTKKEPTKTLKEKRAAKKEKKK